MNRARQVKIVGDKAFVYRLPAGQVKFTGLFLTLRADMVKIGF